MGWKTVHRVELLVLPRRGAVIVRLCKLGETLRRKSVDAEYGGKEESEDAELQE